MKITRFLIFSLITIVMIACTQKKEESNPFFSDYGTEFDVPAFNKIENKHYMPGFEAGMEEQNKNIEAIVNNPEEADFENTIEALEFSSPLLTRVSSVFYNLRSSHTNDSIKEIAKEITPKLSAHSDKIYLNEKLFERVKYVKEHRKDHILSPEQYKLLEETYKAFVDGGANLNHEDKEKLKAINTELADLSLQYGENVLSETNDFKMVIDDEKDLAGLPQDVINAAAITASESGEEGKWVFTIQKSSMIPFLQYSENRELRKKILMAYTNKGDNNDEKDNKAIAAKLASLRVKKANLLGYETWADFVLKDRMAKNPETVRAFLNKLMEPALKVAKKEASDLTKMLIADGYNEPLQPWDWRYYSEKLRKEKYDLDDESLRPYFKLENVRDGAFMVANKLWGIEFTQREDFPTYHEDVQVFEVKEADGKHIGILYLDYFPRESKRGGAWMNEYRAQHIKDGAFITPIITNNGNFTKPTADKPSLLTFDEASTLFHEFGHALHGLLSKCTYPSLSGTNVPRDFVEFPSQIMENWAAHPEVIKSYARHYETGEPIPDELLERMEASGKFNQGFVTVEYLSAAFLDLDWHTMTDTALVNTVEFENTSIENMGLIPEIIVRYRSTYFNHIFTNSYYAGYYSYIWAETLDADAFAAFKQEGIFNPYLAKAYRTNILEKGGTEDPMKLYRQFRGADPNEFWLLEKRGLNL